MSKTSKSDSASAAPDAPLPFEQSLEQLEQIVREIESGQVTLEQSIERYENGMKLISHCRKILDRAESRISQLTADAEGNIKESHDE